MKRNGTARQIIDGIVTVLENEFEDDDMALLAEYILGGTYKYNVEENNKRMEAPKSDWFDTVFDYEPNEHYWGVFDNLKDES